MQKESFTKLVIHQSKHAVKSLYDELEFFVSGRKVIECPLFLSSVSAGFPSPAEDHIERRLDPTDYLIDVEDATFFYTITGLSMLDAGLLPGDKLVVDRSKNARVNHIILALLNGKYTAKYLGLAVGGAPRLIPCNLSTHFPTIEINEYDEFQIIGVVIGSFRRFPK